jgi:hypothetical protein
MSPLSTRVISGTINDTSKSYTVRLWDYYNIDNNTTSSIGAGKNTWKFDFTPSPETESVNIKLYETSDTAYSKLLYSMNFRILKIYINYAYYHGSSIYVDGEITGEDSYNVLLTDNQNNSSSTMSSGGGENMWSFNYTPSNTSSQVSEVTAIVYASNDAQYLTPLASATYRF